MVELAGDSGSGSTRLLAADETPPWIALNPGAASPFLLLGDHAGRVIPSGLTGLGLSDAERRRHIAWDIGVVELGALLSAMLGATFIHQRYSRLVISMSKETQFLFISHNKIAMEMAVQLIGVTMQEQGVSRVVAVDMESAAALAAA